MRDRAVWTAEFRFDRPASAWVFSRSALDEDTRMPWRPQSWTVETPGVRLERRGHFDLLRTDDGSPVPELVRIRFTPYPRGLAASYDPALVFTDGTVALYNQQFDLVPVDGPEAADRLPPDLGDAGLTEGQTRVRFRDVGARVLYQGNRFDEASLAGDGAYVLFGPAEPIVTPTMATIIDPQLPAWLRSALASEVPQLIDHHARELGPPSGGRPTILVSWAGPTPALISMGGSVLTNMVTMRFEGIGVVEPRPALLAQARRFIAHEAAHFWLGQTVRYGSSREAWITEGGADLLAVRAVQALHPDFNSRAQLDEAVTECAGLIENRGVEGAHGRGEHRAYYACGAVFAMVAEAQSGHPYSAFVRGLIDANRPDGVLTRAEWLGALDQVSRDPSIRADIETLLDRGSPQPKQAIAALLRRAGIAHVVAADGTPRLQ